jgi:hypothetical protein
MAVCKYSKLAVKYQTASKYTKIFHPRAFKNIQIHIGIFSMKNYHLATLAQNAFFGWE